MNIVTRSKILDLNTDSESTEAISPPSTIMSRRTGMTTPTKKNMKDSTGHQRQHPHTPHTPPPSENGNSNSNSNSNSMFSTSYFTSLLPASPIKFRSPITTTSPSNHNNQNYNNGSSPSSSDEHIQRLSGYNNNNNNNRRNSGNGNGNGSSISHDNTNKNFPSIPENGIRSDLPVSLEGTLSFRKCKSSKDSKYWKQVYVVLTLTNEGSLTCYAPNGDSNKKGSPTLSSSDVAKKNGTHNLQPKLHLPNYVNWVAKDIAHNATGFVIEVNTIDPTLHVGSFTLDEMHTMGLVGSNNMMSIDGSDSQNDLEGSSSNVLGDHYATNNNIDNSSSSPAGFHHFSTSASMRCLTGNGPPIPMEIHDDIKRAREKHDNFRIYFKCGRSGNEKVLWLRAFEQVDRLSFELHKQRGIIHTLKNPQLKISHSRVRSHHAQRFALEGKVLDDVNSSMDGQPADDPGSQLRERSSNQKGGEKEYMVYPLYAYPNRWMTDAELYAEMLKPSEVFHDTRVDAYCQDEIGVLKVELLQCVGLPALDFASETDATAYMVCGSHAFTTDVIWNRLNPMWLPRSRRACTFPLFHGYARLFVGVFDDDGKGEKDDFAGRVIIDLARCRPRSTYDVTLPLRLSASVYSRRPRGSVRLRFSLDWHSERDALLSYIPKTIRGFGQRPDDDVTVLCADEKAFRNIVTTVHGIHMPGRFSFSQWKATMREANFARKGMERMIRNEAIAIVTWKNPSLSMLVFSSWMYIIYQNSFALVPLHLMAFMTLMMVRTYVFFGADGPIQNGFVPPSWEELALALARSSKQSKVIEPLKVKPFKKIAGRGQKSLREVKQAGTDPPETHRQKGKWFFRLLGFKTARDKPDMTAYHMEFPFSQGLKDPTTGQIQYPKFHVKESLVSKSSLMNRKGKGGQAGEDGDENMMGDLMTVKGSSKRKNSFGLPKSNSKRSNASEDDNSRNNIDGNEQANNGGENDNDDSSNSGFLGVPYEELPPYMRIPEQNIDAKGPARKKKLADELDELQENMHKLTFHMFNDRTHAVRHPKSVYFGQASKADWFQHSNVEGDLERLLNIGQFSSANPVVARVGTYVEPIIHAAQSGLGAYRALYNIVTWRDPMLSFWVSLAMGAMVVILAIFPWRLFFFGLGLVLVGPQNWVVRKMEQRGTTPAFIKTRLDKFRKKKKKKKMPKNRITKELPKGQPVIGCHTSDNSAPATYMPEDVDAREIHQASIPYSQLMTQRFYDWPPEAQYAKCEPTATLSASLQKRSASFGVSRQRAARRVSHPPSASHQGRMRLISSGGGMSNRSALRRGTT